MAIYVLTGPNGFRFHFVERPSEVEFQAKKPPQSTLRYRDFDEVEAPGSTFEWYCGGEWSLHHLATPEDEYWKTILKRRMPFRDEVLRLTTALHGFYARHGESFSLREFWESKRPYGNKDVAASIAFNLGWDFERRLCQEALPEWVAEEALKVHAAVGAQL